VPLRRVLAYALWWMDDSPDEVEALAERLSFPKAMKAIVKGAAVLARQQDTLAKASPSALTFCLEDHPLAAVYALALVARDENLQQRLHQYAAAWRHIRPATTGHDLRALGLSPGPQYKRILRALRAAWLDGEVASPAEEKALLQRLIAEGASARLGRRGGDGGGEVGVAGKTQ